MANALTTALRISTSVWSDVLGNPDLRRLEGGRVWSVAAEAIATVGLGLYAFRTHGVSAVALVVAIQVLPGALTAPLLAPLSDRLRRERVMCAAEATRAAAVIGIALVARSHGSIVLVYLLAAVLAVASSAFYPARRSLVPLLVRTPRQLMSTNIASVTLQSVGLIAGPALAAVVLAVSGRVSWLFVVAGCGFVASSISAALISRTDAVRVPFPATVGFRAALAGFRAAARDPATRLLLSLFVVKNLGRGALNLLVIAVPLQLLHLENVSVALLSVALGAGGLAAGVVGGLVQRPRLGRTMVVGLVLWGAPLLLVALRPTITVAVLCMVVLGLGNALVDASGYTLLVRTVRDDVLARVYGVHEALRALAIAVGSIGAAALITQFGVRVALVGAGLVVCGSSLIALTRVMRVDRSAVVPVDELAALRRTPIFAHLLPVTIERLARCAARMDVVPGTDVVTEGEPGEAMYVIASGTADVVSAGRTVRTLSIGDYFGEIALLQDVPRTATVRAASPLTLYAIDREEFVAAACGHPLSSSVAARGTDERLRELEQLAAGRPSVTPPR
jgi:MFS family permease